MSATSVWMIVGPAVHAAYRNRLAAESADPPQEYTGPMDDESYAIMSTMQSPDAVQNQYKIKGEGPGSFILYSTYYADEAQAIAAVDWMNDTWPKPQVIEQGGWYRDTGLQIGMSYTFDEDGNIDGTTGTPRWPIPDDLYLIMPDTVVYDEDGNEVSRTPASSNADLRDVNVLAGQVPRDFFAVITLELTAKSISDGFTGFEPAGSSRLEPGAYLQATVARIGTSPVLGGTLVFDIELGSLPLPQDLFGSIQINGLEVYSEDATFDSTMQTWVWTGTAFEFEDDTDYTIKIKR